MLLLASLILGGISQARTPLDLARLEINKSAGSNAKNVEISIKPSKQKESYTITAKNGKATIVGTDQVGAMYGAFEFAERLHQQPDKAWKTNVSNKPFLADRGLNLFLTLPWNYAKNDTDYELGALTDPNRWWFHNEDYWTTLLDMMAHSRLNWLDIHGGWDISVTNAPNLYAYFVTSPSFPKVGVPEDVKAKDIKQLNHVIEMAHERGIRVSLMAYEANLRIPQNPNPGYDASEPSIYKYTKEVVEQMIRKAPGLDAIGYRIGESGRSESFFKCYGEAVKASGREIPIITRSWITRKQRVLPLARASKDFTVEIKYNGEQWGAPYMVAGGRMANWQSYSYEDYLSDSGKGNDAKTWQGNPTTEGKQWPSEPYKIVWQVRANGTHRIFPFYNPNWVRRSINVMKIGTSSGYTIEGEDAYYPKSPDYYLANAKDKYCDWIHQRDEMYWMTWGRLGYDPTTPDTVFDARAKELLGKGSDKLVAAWKEASLIVPKAYMAFSLGPDHRNHAPELEWGGDTNAFLQSQPFDSLTFLPINESWANQATNGIDGRRTLVDATDFSYVDDFPELKKADLNPRGREIATSIEMTSALARYYKSRIKVAQSLPDVLQHIGHEASSESLAYEMHAATTAYGFLSENPFYKPFTERLRMHTNTFNWKAEYKKVETEERVIRNLPRSDYDGSYDPSSLRLANIDAKLTWSENHGEITCRLDVKQITTKNLRTPREKPKVLDEGIQNGYLLVKPLPSSTFFHKIRMIQMDKVGKHFETTFKRESFGYAIAAECSLYRGYFSKRIPDSDQETPYIVIPSQAGPTPQFYSSEEAMTFLDPSVITPEKYGAILIGCRAPNFFHEFNRATKRKILEPVEKGLKLIILQQDFNKNKLDFLPHPLQVEAAQESTFDPAGQLGLVKATFPGAMWQKFVPSEGWEVFGNGGLARMKLGKGEVWVTSARLMQNMHLPDAAKDFVALLGAGGKTKPTILIDSNSEGGEMTSSNHPDLMNSHNIPFMTLGEVIAKEQGMNSFTPIPGPTMNDDVLNGQGQAIASKFVRDRVIAMSKQPTAPSVAAFEKLRVTRKKELLRSLGLDPMPAKTPLNARITGTIQRNGYHIEKVVFESRPNFYVTCHVYVPDGFHGKLPIVVNVNGHWAHKKNEDRIQLRCALQATQGYIAIAVDSPGWSFEGNSLIERRPEGDHNDFALVQGGTNTTGYYVWDTIRALDYMATRDDADMSRIGLTGASGGGLGTLYTFAADDRYTAAVPVVYMASMELAPDNGCLCNHVPATSQIGDRSDVIGIQAPKPVYIMGAQNDGEFPPDATRLTAKKMQESWDLFGKKNDVYVQIFGGGHDYNQLMREASIGFFNKYLKGEGNGSPVPQPSLQAIDPEDHQLLVVDPPIPGERTMRDLSLEYLKNAPKDVSVDEFIRINGGRPAKSDLKLHIDGKELNYTVTFESEPGLVTPGILFGHLGNSDELTIYINDEGKAAQIASLPDYVIPELFLDILGTGELSGFDLRFPVYAGRSVAFTGGWQIVRAVEAMRKYAKRINIMAEGPLSSQAAMIAGLLDPSINKIEGYKCMKTWEDAFKDGFPEYAIQPRAHLCGSLENLRKKVKNGQWYFK